ncbi:uncharacterized protein [Chamaea fasciata]|uniref:uncharacterized protein isoform X2 n=1 Tax=Chamaea fasciata TaxID=190680 RepID=UPI00336A6B20
MSQRKRSKGFGSSQMTDGEDDFIPTQTERRSQDQVSELVQFLLVKDQKKIPIKRADMLKNVIREYRDAYSEIVNKAGKTLQEVFGLQLVEIDSKRHTYILINNLPRAEGKYLCRDEEKEKMGLLLIILSFIFMKGNSVKDSESSPQPPCTSLCTSLTDTPFSRCFVGVPAPAPCVPREAAPGVRGRSEAGDGGVCAAEVPGDHPHPPDRPPGIQIPVGATVRKGDLQERCAERRGQDTRQGSHILVKPVQRGRGHPLTTPPPPKIKTPRCCAAPSPIFMLSAWLYKV